MEMDIHCVDHMRLCKWEARCSDRYTEVKKDTNTGYQKREHRLTGRGSQMFSGTPAVVHIHRKYLRTQNNTNQKTFFFFQRLKTSQQERKALPHDSTLCFFCFLNPFCLFVCFLFWIFGGWRGVKVQSQFLVPSSLQGRFHDNSIGDDAVCWIQQGTGILWIQGPLLRMDVTESKVTAVSYWRWRSESFYSVRHRAVHFLSNFKHDSFRFPLFCLLLL